MQVETCRMFHLMPSGPVDGKKLSNCVDLSPQIIKVLFFMLKYRPMKMTIKHPFNSSICLLLTLGLCTQSSTFAQTNTPVAQESTVAHAYFEPLELDPVLFNSPYTLSLFSPKNGEDGARVWSQTKMGLFVGVGAFLFLAALPEESTGWEKSDNIFGKWVDNVKNSPEWDRNKWAYNYIGHLYVGGMYYQVARKSGYRQWDSFVYTCLMSSFFWEYGIEAFAEVPSIQDLVYTPLAGWIYGEWAFQTERCIRANDDEVLGSGLLGTTCLLVLDPIDYLGRGVNFVTRHKLVKAGYGYFSYVPGKTSDGQTDHKVYLNMRIPIGAAGPDEPNTLKPIKYTDDPIDTGILGFGAGIGHTAMDKKWGVNDDLFTKITLGIYFTPRISGRLEYAWGDLTQQSNGEIIEYENYSWNTQLYLNPTGKLRPYISGGLGRQTWFEDNNTANFQWNAGLGVHWQFYRKLSLNADWLNYYSPSSGTYDQQFNAGLTYRFGQGERDDWY